MLKNSKIQEFKNTLKFDIRPIAFIHKKTDVHTISDFEDIRNQYIRMINLIRYHRKNLEFIVIALSNSDDFSTNWNIPNLITKKIHTPKLWGCEPPETAWKETINYCVTYRLFL